MITRTEKIRQRVDWQSALASAVTDVDTLLTRLALSPQDIDVLRGKIQFPIRVTTSFLQRMQPGNPRDPLLRQVLALPEELQRPIAFERDPLKESEGQPVPGLIHKYPGRVLLIATGACAIHCRYCFRQHFPYNDNSITRTRFTAMLSYLSTHTEIQEVILSGGDPLSLSDDRLAEIIEALEKIPHLKIVRFHSRLPIVLPERMTERLLQLFSTTRFPVVFVLHSNHANELNDEVKTRIMELKSVTQMVLNQTVLLRGVNDAVETLSDLSERLFACGVLPYYLHQLDKVTGTHHFEVSDEIAQHLIKELSTRLPGYLVPKLVREIPGELSKVPV